MPPKGLAPEQISGADKRITSNCRRIEPRYVPRISREEIDGRSILVVWVPASEIPPHQASDGHKQSKKYWVRIDRRTVDAQSTGLLTQLLNQAATVPRDSRIASNATVDDLRERMVREHLRDCGSALLDEPDTQTIYRKMDIVRRVNGHDVPCNVAPLFFSRNPSHWFPGALIETSLLQAGAGGDVVQEKEFKGGLAEQVCNCLAYLRHQVIESRIEKIANHLSASHHTNYPEDALRELLANALFHRGYGVDERHTTLVRVTSDRIEIRSMPGPVAGIDLMQFQHGAALRLVPPRYPRIGEKSKDIGLTEKRLTGLGKVLQGMERNGTPPPQFYFDEQRTFFQATEFAHALQITESTIRKAGEVRAVGRPREALDVLESAWRSNPASPVLVEELTHQCVIRGDLTMRSRWSKPLWI